ncbi:MAG: glucose-1-phosphate thymidylyltransferase RfbA [Candidatus Lokiarchaeota archaeon]|nr:glucose-1-phosphate thymidylyltransferase RfbA [Candidatus Lokiarchaeota archaeon]
MKKTKGIILAGGTGSRMYPITEVYSKQLIMVYDKPMIYYPLSTLIMAGIQQVLIISNEETIPMYKQLFSDGSHLGMSIQYEIQKAPKGIAEVFIIGKEFIGEDQVIIILGDNIFYGYLNFLRDAIEENRGGTIFGYYVKDPERYGVVDFDAKGNVISLEEKPKKPKSNFAIPGLYIYDNQVVEIAKNLYPSDRGELEITDVNKEYLKQGKLSVKKIGRGIAWLDTGTPESLLDASNFIAAIEQRQGLKIGCIEEAAYRMKFLELNQLQSLIDTLPTSNYKEYLEIMKNEKLKKNKDK